MNNNEIKITHFIDRQFGHPIHLGTCNGIIKFIASTGNGEKFDEKFKTLLIDQTLGQAQEIINNTFPKVVMHIIPFGKELDNKISEYK